MLNKKIILRVLLVVVVIGFLIVIVFQSYNLGYHQANSAMKSSQTFEKVTPTSAKYLPNRKGYTHW